MVVPAKMAITKNGVEINTPATPPVTTVPINTAKIRAKNPPIITDITPITEQVRQPRRH